jgi:hypothetical protein
MKNVVYIKIFFITVFLLSGCGFFDSEESLETNREELNEVVTGFFASYWKGAKICIRSLPIKADSENINFEEIRESQSEQLRLGKHLSRIYDMESIVKGENFENEPLSAKEYVELAKEVYSMAGNIEHLNEDDYPTFLEVISNSRQALKREPLDYPAYWNNAMEHWMFAIVMESGFTFGSWKTYELDKLNPGEFATSDLKVGAYLHKGIDHLRNEWFYLAEAAFSDSIDVLSQKKIQLQPEIDALISEVNTGNLSNSERFRFVTRAFTYLSRGYSRHQMDTSSSKELALQDIESAIKDFSNAGINNELVWIAESYLYIKNEETDKAVESLAKLENSPYISKKEKKLIADAKKKIINRDPDAALNIVTDKVIMAKLGMSYAASYAVEIKWMTFLEKTEEGRRILARFSELDQTLEKAKKYMNVDKLKSAGSDLVDELKK